MSEKTDETLMKICRAFQRAVTAAMTDSETEMERWGIVADYLDVLIRRHIQESADDHERRHHPDFW
jgi:hypothetical protein